MAAKDDLLDAFFKDIDSIESAETTQSVKDNVSNVITNTLPSVSASVAPKFSLPIPSVLPSTGVVKSTAVVSSAPQRYTGNSSHPEKSNIVTTLKPTALPSDIELISQKKKNEEAFQNSYMGQVIRGEKTMKRFLRCAGGERWEDNSLAEWDPNDFRIFCGDLGNEVNDDLLTKTFRKYPSFQKAKLVRDTRTGKSKGYGFISFRKQEDFIKAMREMDGKYVGNRPIKLRKSNWEDRSMEVVKKKKKEKERLGLY
uniref:RNA-binding protein 42 n=1 Tax=Rhabditophanes sp. KR3021 TaxID=114890 RepID=A0AC35TT57_9BILA